jgi:hypothetical protein
VQLATNTPLANVAMRIFQEKKPGARPPRRPEQTGIAGSSGGRGFSSCGHRLASLYRTYYHDALTLTQGYQPCENGPSSLFKYAKSDMFFTRLGRGINK